MRRSGIRAAAWAAIAGQAAFVGSWALAGALQDHYSHLEQGVSDLAGLTARHAWIVQAGFVVFGLSLAALVPGLRALLPRRRAATATALLFLLAGAGFVLVAFFRLDCSLAASDACADRFHAGLLSWHTSAHLWAGLVAEVALVGTPFALARALWPRFAGGAALAAGGSGIAIGTATAIAYAVAAGATPDGLVERLELGFAQAWIVIVAAGILHATHRRREDLSSPIPARPRDFFGPAWSGEGELVAWPPFLWGRFPTRFRFTRTSTFHSDRVWTVDDVAHLPGGHVERRRRFCELVAPARIHVTSDDMPDGADVVLGDDGYRISSYKVLVPIGPLRFTLRCRDHGRLAPDGSLVDTIDFRWLGLPVARMTGRARPEPAGAPAGPAEPETAPAPAA